MSEESIPLTRYICKNCSAAYHSTETKALVCNKCWMELIVPAAAAECWRQRVGPDRVIMLLSGYVFANSLVEPITKAQLRELAGMIEPDNKGAYRITPVSFADTSLGIHAALVPGLMNALITFGHVVNPTEWIKEFLDIHPFTDGNGRTAWVLFNKLNGTMDNPLPLPDLYSDAKQ